MPETPRPAPTDAELARYVAEQCAELRRLTAGRPALRTAHYLLGVVRQEAERAGDDPGPSHPGQIAR